MKSKTRKIIATIMLILILLTSLPIETFATFITDMNSDAQFGVISNSLANYGHELHYANYDGTTYLLFCTEYGQTSPTGSTYTYNSDFIVQYKSNLSAYEKVAEMIYFGYTMNYGMGLPSSTEAIQAACATQQYVWEYIHNYIDSSTSVPSRSSWVSTYMSESIYSSWLTKTENYYNLYHSSVSFSDTTASVCLGNVTTLTDTNGVLAYFESFSQTVDGVTFSHIQGSNDLTITVDSSNTNDTVTFSSTDYNLYELLPNGSAYDSSTMSNYVYFKFASGAVQNLMFSNYIDPVTFKVSVNVETGNVLIVKTNSNGDTLSGCGFEIYSDSGCTNKISSGTSDSSGQISFNRLSPGTYYVKEVSVPTGYLLDTTVQSVTVVANQTATVSFANSEPTGYIKVQKVNSNGDAIEGVTFEVIAGADITNVAKTVTYYSKGDVVETIKTNSSGIAKTGTLPLGTYIVKEKSTVSGYILNTEEFTVNLTYKDSSTSVIEGLVSNIVNKEPTGEITLEKTDSTTGNSDRIDGTSHHGDASIKGAVYTLYASEDIYNVAKTVKYFSKNDEIATYTFNEYGVATLSITNTETSAVLSANENTLCGLPLGTYYAYETTVPTGYTQDTNKYSFAISYKDSSTSTISISNTVKNTVQRAKFEVIKISSNTSAVAKVIEGAEFTAILTKYVDYYGSFDEALKHLDEFADDEYSVFTTGSNGHGVSGYLAYGKYTVNETYTPDGVNTVEEFYVTINQNSDTVIKELVANDMPFEAYIKLVKKDIDSGKIVTLSNTTFSLYKLNEDTNEWESVSCKVGSKVYTTWTTNEDGVAETETKLEYGTYKVEEVVTPEGYLDLEEDLIFEVSSNNETVEYDEDYDAWITVVAENKQPTGKLNLTKLINLREDADTTLITDIDFTQISFRLVANEDIIDYADGDVIFAKETEIGIYYLESDGTLTISGLPMGSYYLEEMTTIDGAILNDTLYDVVFTKEDNTTKEYVINLQIENDTTFVEFSKTDITGDEELEGATLQVLDSEGNIVDEWISTSESHKIEGLSIGETYTLHEEIAVDGYVKATDVEFTVYNTSEMQTVTMIDKVVTMTKVDIAGNELEGATIQVIDSEENIVDKWISETEPHKINGLVEGETYILHEEIAIEGYVKATDVEFTVTEDKETQNIEMIDKIVQITKEDIGGEEIEGATLQVIDSEENIVDEWVSTNEPHKVNGLIEGETYTLHEEICVDGYVKASDVEFTVTEDKETQEITMIDKIVTMTKADIAGDEIEGAEMMVIDENGEIIDSWTSTKEAHRISGLEENKTYILHEEYAPNGYVIATDIEFTVTEDKETQEIIMIDKAVEITKADIGGKEIEGATLQVLDSEGNVVDEWISTDEAHKVNNLVEGETYTLHEEICADGYVKAIDVEFTVDYDKETQEIVMIDKIVEVTKTDLTTGEEIEGAELQVVDENGDIIDEWTSTTEPHKITGLEEGKTYTLIEITAPYGYEIAESVEFTVTYDKETQLVEMKDMPILVNIQVEKIDSATGEHIKSNKFTFGIYADAECTELIEEVGANELEGTALFEDLRYGTYYIRELSAPTGYSLSDQVVTIEINDEGVFADGVSLEEMDGVYSFAYYNTLLPVSVVQTGNETNYILLIIILIVAIVGFVSGIIVLMKRCNNR